MPLARRPHLGKLYLQDACWRILFEADTPKLYRDLAAMEFHRLPDRYDGPHDRKCCYVATETDEVA